jgi:hypothetical protein
MEEASAQSVAPNPPTPPHIPPVAGPQTPGGLGEPHSRPAAGGGGGPPGIGCGGAQASGGAQFPELGLLRNAQGFAVEFFGGLGLLGELIDLS